MRAYLSAIGELGRSTCELICHFEFVRDTQSCTHSEFHFIQKAIGMNGKCDWVTSTRGHQRTHKTHGRIDNLCCRRYAREQITTACACEHPSTLWSIPFMTVFDCCAKNRYGRTTVITFFFIPLLLIISCALSFWGFFFLFFAVAYVFRIFVFNNA